MLIPGMATATVATDTVDTTGLTATMERGLLMPSQSPPLLLTLTLMLMLGTATMDTVATATTVTDTDMATTVLTDTDTDGTERGQQMLSQSPLLPLSPRLMLMPGTDITATATVAMDMVATTDLMVTMATLERGLLMPSLQLMP